MLKKSRTRSWRLTSKLLLFFLLGLATIAQSSSRCKLAYTKKPPFWVVTGDNGMADKDYENLRVKKENSDSLSARYQIPKNSIVIQRDAPTIKNGKSNEYIPITVLSVPKTQVDQKKQINYNFRKYKDFNQILHSSDKKTPELGTHGYISKGSVEKLENGDEILNNPSIVPPAIAQEQLKNSNFKGDFLFVVKEENEFFNIEGGDDLTKDHVLELSTRDGKYLVQKCTDDENPENNSMEYVFNIYKIENGQKQSLGFKLFDPNAKCCQQYISTLLPVQPKVIEPLLHVQKSDPLNRGIDELLLLDGKQLLQVPQGPLRRIPALETGERGQCYSEGPYGSFHYIASRETNCDKIDKAEQQADSLLKPHAACSMVGALKSIKEKCPDCAVQWGNLYYPLPNPGKKGHRSHYTGRCIDFRPLQKTNNLGPLTYKSKKIYSRERTKILMEEFLKAGADKIIFNDYKLRKSISKEVKDGASVFGDSQGTHSHDDHLHICFPEKENLEDLYKLKDKLSLRPNKNKSQIKNLEKRIKVQEKMKNSCKSNSL